MGTRSQNLYVSRRRILRFAGDVIDESFATPVSVAPTVIGSTTATVRWVRIISGGPVVSWRVEVNGVVWPDEADIGSGTYQTLDVTGLPDNTLLDMRVRAVSAIGVSPWSNITQFTTDPLVSFYLLLESGDSLLLETGDNILTEDAA